jgi:succinate dehydrogenase/fumarate reductase cytochrome b subunit
VTTPPSLPETYRRFYRTHLRFALVMIVVALLAGICFQESGKKVHITEAVPVGAHLEYVLSLALVHGHIFLVGVLLPLAFTWMLHLTAALGLEPVPGRTLSLATALYLPGNILTIILMLLKGYHLVLGVRHGAVDFNALNGSFLGSSQALRAGLYGLSHLAMGAGLCLLAAGLWRSLRTR